MITFSDKIKARTEGSVARDQGKPRESCPYFVGDERMTEWFSGYDGQGELLAKVFPAAGGPLRGGRPA